MDKQIIFTGSVFVLETLIDYLTYGFLQKDDMGA
jgi:hypothetical protein